MTTTLNVSHRDGWKLQVRKHYKTRISPVCSYRIAGGWFGAQIVKLVLKGFVR